MSEHPEPEDEGYEEWLSEIIGCPNCGETDWTMVEMRYGARRGDLVELCDNCGFPYSHEGSSYE